MPDLSNTETARARRATPAATGRREERRRQREELNRAHLLDAAEEVFGAKGFHETTVKEIADLAEFSVGSVYSLISDKDDLFRQIFIRRGDQFMPGTREVLERPGSARERLHALVDYQVRFFRQHPHFGRVYVRSATQTMSTPDDKNDPIVSRRYEEALRMQAELFAEGQRTGELGPGDPATLARLLSGMVSSFVTSDPAVMTADPDAPELLPLSRFHELVDRAFGV